MMLHHGATPACAAACLTSHVPLSAMPRGSMPHSLAEAGSLVALASPQPCPLAMQRIMHHGMRHGPMQLAFPPTAVPLSTADLATSALLFAVGLCDAHATTNRARTALEDNLNQHPLPPPRP